MYTYNSTTNTWVNQSDVVSTDANNIVVEGTDGLAFLDAAAVEAAAGTSSGTGAPTVDPLSPPAAGDVYVDETTGDVYTYNSVTNTWENQSADGNQVHGIVATPKPATTPPTPTAANLPASPVSGDTVTEIYNDYVVHYAYDGTNWSSVEYAKSGGGSSTGLTNGTTNNNTLRWDAATNSWKETTALTTSSTATEGVSVGSTASPTSLRLSGAVYGNLRIHTAAGGIVWQDDDFIVVITSGTFNTTGLLLLPKATPALTGRILSIRNQTGGFVQFKESDPSGDAPKDYPSISAGSATMFVCDGTLWHPIGGR